MWSYFNLQKKIFLFFCCWRMPFNSNTPLGFLITLLLECTFAYFALLFMIPVLCILFGSCYLLKSFAEDISTDLKLLNVTKTTTDSDGNTIKIQEIICNATQSHSELKQLKMSFYILIFMLKHMILSFFF